VSPLVRRHGGAGAGVQVGETQRVHALLMVGWTRAVHGACLVVVERR